MGELTKEEKDKKGIGNFFSIFLNDKAVEIDHEDENKNTKPPKKIIKNANNKVLIDVLCPEVTHNEKKKRRHKDVLLLSVGALITLQFVFFFILAKDFLESIVTCQIDNNPYTDESLKIIFTFLGAYITSIVVELIAMLKYIVKNVFDTSIAELINNFKDTLTNNSPQQKTEYKKPPMRWLFIYPLP